MDKLILQDSSHNAVILEYTHASDEQPAVKVSIIGHPPVLEMDKIRAMQVWLNEFEQRYGKEKQNGPA
jgi:hypothetical protein